MFSRIYIKGGRKMQANNNQNSTQKIRQMKERSRAIRQIKKEKLPNILVMEKELEKYIIGQDRAIRSLLIAVYRKIKIQTIKTNILIIGGSGSGKTETMKQLSRILDMPYTIEDATKYTKEGYVGQDVTEMIYNLYDSANGDLEKAENGMLIIDEIDKKVNRSEIVGNDISGTDVLNSMLKLVEGVFVPMFYDQETDETYGIDTAKLMVVFMGAFDGINDIRKKRLSTTSGIGFSSQTQNQNQKEVKDSRYTKEDLIEFGLPTEFVGRIDTIVEYDKLSKEMLAKIARESKLSIFRKYEKYFAENGIKLEYDDSIFDKIAEKAVKTNSGARELSNVVNGIFEPILYDVFKEEPEKYKVCKLNSEFIYDPEKSYLLE